MSATRDWKAIRERILARAGNACECRGECGDEHVRKSDGLLAGTLDVTDRCGAPNGARIGRLIEAPSFWLRFEADSDAAQGEQLIGSDVPYEAFSDPIRVVLTIAHLDHVPEHCDDGNLLALCQRCRLLLDRDHRRESARRTRDARRGQGGLFE